MTTVTTQTSIEKAIALSRLGIYVFPVNANNKRPVLENGHLEATIDTEQIATWFTGEFSNCVVGVNTGRSELVVLDIDVDESKNGFASLGFLPIPDTFSYPTTSKTGKHFLYELADSPSLPPQNKYRKYPGIDRKSGSSYVIFWGDEVPESRDVFASPPEWLLDMPSDFSNSFSGFSGGVDEWLETCPQGEPTATVQEIIDNIPTEGFGHGDVLSITYRLVRLAAEGHTGVDDAFDILAATWIRPPYDGPQYRKEFSDAVLGAIRKAGEEDVDVKNLPPYSDSLELANSELLDLLTSAIATKVTYFKAIRKGAAQGLEDETLASLVWNAPATKIIARDWGLSYLYEQITKAKAEVEIQAERPTVQVDTQDNVVSVDSNVSILTDEERELIKDQRPFVKRYVDHASSRTVNPNTPYQRINAWTIVSAAFSSLGYIPRRNGKEGLNCYTMTLGETTTGKSWERKLMFSFLKEIFATDPEFNIGGNPSPSALGKKLLERDGRVSFFNKDEAHGALKSWQIQDWQSGLLEDLAELYDGRVPPQLRTKDWESSGKSAETHFLMHLMGTPKAMIAAMNRDLFGTGFLARFQWAIGNPRVVSYDSMAENDSDGDDVRLGFDPMSRQIAAEFALMSRYVRREADADRIAIRIDRKAAKRLQDAKWQLTCTFEKDRNFDILEPSLVRIGVTIRKAASLIALSEGRITATMRDVLLALEAAEEWVSNLVSVANQISASDFERSCDEIEQYVIDRGGEVRKSQLLRRFKHIEGRFLDSYIQALYGQERLYEYTGERKMRYVGTPKIEE